MNPLFLSLALLAPHNNDLDAKAALALAGASAAKPVRTELCPCDTTRVCTCGVGCACPACEKDGWRWDAAKQVWWRWKPAVSVVQPATIVPVVYQPAPLMFTQPAAFFGGSFGGNCGPAGGCSSGR